MPESRESEASYLIVEAAVSDLIEEGITLRIEHIEIDATDKEQARFPKDHPARNGLPYIINSDCPVKRGNNKSQGSVFPEMRRTFGKSPQKSLTDLVLKGISYTHRALILDFGVLFLMVNTFRLTSFACS